MTSHFDFSLAFKTAKQNKQTKKILKPNFKHVIFHLPIHHAEPMRYIRTFTNFFASISPDKMRYDSITKQNKNNMIHIDTTTTTILL